MSFFLELQRSFSNLSIFSVILYHFLLLDHVLYFLLCPYVSSEAESRFLNGLSI